MENRKAEIKWEVAITIIISVAGLFISLRANQTYELQAEIARNTALPNIQINEFQELDEYTNQAVDTVIEISNLEGKLSNYNSEIITVLQCQYIDKNYNCYTAEVPLHYYYIIGYRSGLNNGIIETKISTNNYKKIVELEKEVLKFNYTSKEETLLIQKRITYIKISYVDLLSNNETLYYVCNSIKTQLIDKQEGENIFNKLRYIEKKGLGIYPNDVNKISVDDLINNIYSISELDYRDNINNKKGIDIMSELIAAIIGAVLAYFFTIRQEKKNEKNEESHAASILYYDLKSIEQYIKEEDKLVNLRYSNKWQSIVASCSFLSDEDIGHLYKIYDAVYNYNEAFAQKINKKKQFDKKKLSSYKKLQKLFINLSESSNLNCVYNDEYKKIIDKLSKVKDRK